MVLDGVLYTVTDYMPCLDCADVYLVEAVCVAQLTDAVRTALGTGDLQEVTCRRCGFGLSSALPLLLCGTGSEMTLWYAPALGSSGLDPTMAGWLLLMLKARHPHWPAADPVELTVVERPGLAGLAGGSVVPGSPSAIPHELWHRTPPPPLPFPSEKSRRQAWDDLLRIERELLDSFEESFEARGDGSADELAGVARRLVHTQIRRYRALGDPDELGGARDSITRALRAASTDAMRARILTDLGAVAMLEYQRRGDAELVREASAAFREAIECDPTNTVAAGGLGAALNDLRTWNDDPALLNEAVVALRRAAAQSGTDGGDRAVRLNNLGSALSSRWELSRDRRDLSEAAIALAEAVTLTPADSPEAAARHNNLGSVYARAHRQGGGAAMLDLAIEEFEAAVATSGAGDPDLPGRHANLAGALWQREALGDRARASDLFRIAASGRDDDPEGALLAACNWCVLAFELESWAEVIEAYGHALATSDLLLDRQVTGGARSARLRVVQGLPDLAAFAWAQSGDGLGAARALEAGRSRLLADALELVAAGVEAARTVTPELVARRAALIGEMERVEHSMDDEALDANVRVARAVDARRLRKELTKVMTEINAAASAGAQPPDSMMARVARRGPLVYVACTPSGTVTSVVRAEPLAAELVWSPQLTSNVVADLLAGLSTEAGLDHALVTVGRLLVGQLAPVVAAHDAAEVVMFSLPATLARLPLAAAPFPVDGTARRLVDDHVAALLPSASIAAPWVGVADRGVRLGGVANPARAGMAPLPFATVELQSAASQIHAADGDLLDGHSASVDGVLAILGRCSHLHLACHGQFRPDDPLDSCLRLADGDLSLRRMQRVERAAALHLVVLSACESAQSDTAILPDEMIGLPTALLQLGAQTVIGALWPVPDLPTYVLMARFYQHLAAERLPPGQALRAAQNWLRTASTSALVTSLEEATTDGAGGALVGAAARVLGRQYAPDDRPFASTSTWAGFVVFGGQSEGGSP